MKKLALISVVGLILTGCGGSDSNSNGSNDNNTQAPSAIQEPLTLFLATPLL